MKRKKHQRFPVAGTRGAQHGAGHRALAVRHTREAHGDEAVCLVLAADHLISDDAAFEEAIAQATEQAQQGNLVVFGIRPTAPETGYGYLEVAETGDAPLALSSFVEKPDRATAEQYLAEGRYYWNSGMFCFTAGAMAENMAVHAGDEWAASEIAFAEAQEEASVTRFAKDSFNRSAGYFHRLCGNGKSRQNRHGAC